MAGFPRFRAALLALSLGASLVARQAPPAQAPGDSAIALAHRVQHLKEALEKGQPDQVDAAMAEVETLRRDYTAFDVAPLVEAMTLWARQQGGFGHPALGLAALDKVERWAPQDPAILSTRIALTRQMGVEGWLWSVPDLLRLTAKRLEHPSHRWLWLVQHLGGLRLMATILLWGWALAMGLRYRNALRELWEEPLREKGLSTTALAAAGAAILAGPVVLGLDPSLAAIIWLILLAPILDVAEARLTVFVVALQLLHPMLAMVEPRAFQAPAPSIVTLQLQPQVDPAGDERLRLLPATDKAFIHGWRQLQAQDWAGAEGTFKALAGSSGDRPLVLNNLGVAEFMQGRVEEADKHFSQAYLLDPGRAEVLLNQSIVDFDKVDTLNGALKQEAARRADPSLFSDLSYLSEARGASSGHRAYPSPLPDTPERVKALQGAMGAGQSQGKLLSPQVTLGLVVPLLALVLLLWRFRTVRFKSYPAQCIRCGDPFKSTDSPYPGVCSQCHHLFVVKDGVHAASRKRKVDQLAGHQRTQRWIHRSLVVLLPGCDLAFLGDTGTGFWEWFFVCLALGIVISTGPAVRYPGEILPDPVSLWLPLGAFFVALFYLRSWVKLLPKRRI